LPFLWTIVTATFLSWLKNFKIARQEKVNTCEADSDIKI